MKHRKKKPTHRYYKRIGKDEKKIVSEKIISNKQFIKGNHAVMNYIPGLKYKK